MSINTRNTCIIYLLLYFSLLVGYYFNEDFGQGYITDYSVHKIFVSLFEKDFTKTLFNFDKRKPYGQQHYFYWKSKSKR